MLRGMPIPATLTQSLGLPVKCTSLASGVPLSFCADRSQYGDRKGAQAKAAAALGFCALLSACATPNCPKPAVELRTITVDRPIPVPCVKSADLPSVPAKIGDQLNGDAVHDASVLASALLRMRATAETQSALLKACAKP